MSVGVEHGDKSSPLREQCVECLSFRIDVAERRVVKGSYYTRFGTTSTKGFPKTVMELNPKTLLLLENTVLTSNLWSRPSVVQRFERAEESSDDEQFSELGVCCNKGRDYGNRNLVAVLGS